MEGIILNVKALAAMKNMSIKELASACHIGSQHLLDVSAGRTKMTIEDLRKLSKYTKVPADNIDAS